MDAGRLLGTLHIVARNGVHQGPVLLLRVLEAPRIAHGRPPDACQLFPQVIDDVAQPFVARRAVQDIVEGHIVFDDLVHVVFVDAVLDLEQQELHLLQLFPRNAFRRQARRQRLQARADLIDVVDVLEGHIGHIGAAPRDHDDKPFQLQFADGFADRRAADPHFIGKLDFHEPFARGERPVDDGLADVLAHEFPQGFIAVQTNLFQMSAHRFILPVVSVTAISRSRAASRSAMAAAASRVGAIPKTVGPLPLIMAARAP